MARFGQGLNPQLTAVDYSPIMQGTQVAAQGIQQGGAAIGNALAYLGQKAGDVIQQRGEMKGQVKAAEVAIKSVQTNPMIPQEMKAFLLQQAEAFKDPNLSLMQQAQIANQVNGVYNSVLSAGINSFLRQEEEKRANAPIRLAFSPGVPLADTSPQGRALYALSLNGDPAKVNAAVNAMSAPGAQAGPTTAMRDTMAIVENEIAAGMYPRDPKIIAERTAELLGAGGREPSERYDNAGTYVLRSDQTGAVTAVKNRKTGQIGVVNQKGQFEPLDPGKYMPMTTGDANAFLNESDFKKLSDQLIEQEIGVKAVNRFLKNTEDISSGIQKGMDSFSKRVKSIIGLEESDLTPAEKSLGLAKAQQQRLLGALRTTILGPGVLTEIDAQRILDAVGGDVEAISTNKEIMQQLVGEILREKMTAYEQNLNIYNQHVAGRYGRSGYSQRTRVQPYTPQKVVEVGF